ncbi:MAG: hypothetical protein Q9207_003597 [Kuettlingeria erythrocarpa]
MVLTRGRSQMAPTNAGKLAGLIPSDFKGTLNLHMVEKEARILQGKALDTRVQAAVDKALAERTAEEWVRNVEKEFDDIDFSLPDSDARHEGSHEHDDDTLDGLSNNTNQLRIENEVTVGRWTGYLRISTDDLAVEEMTGVNRQLDKLEAGRLSPQQFEFTATPAISGVEGEENDLGDASKEGDEPPEINKNTPEEVGAKGPKNEVTRGR